MLLNQDVLKAVQKGELTAKQHLQWYGIKEGRLQYAAYNLLNEMKSIKHERIRELLKEEMEYDERGNSYNFLSDELRKSFNIIETDNVSGHGYGPYALALIEKYKDGLILDCGAGNKGAYYENVVNFEIADYITTDVR